MQKRTLGNMRVRYRSSDVGKCICLSFPHHQLTLLEDLDRLAEQEFLTRSQYVRRLIIREKMKEKQQETHSWTSMYGAK